MLVLDEWLLKIARGVLLVLFALGAVSGLQCLIYPDSLTFTYFLYAGGLAGMPWSITGAFLPDSFGFQVIQAAIYWASAVFNYTVISRRLRSIKRSKPDI